MCVCVCVLKVRIDTITNDVNNCARKETDIYIKKEEEEKFVIFIIVETSGDY